MQARKKKEEVRPSAPGTDFRNSVLLAATAGKRNNPNVGRRAGDGFSPRRAGHIITVRVGRFSPALHRTRRWPRSATGSAILPPFAAATKTLNLLSALNHEYLREYVGFSGNYALDCALIAAPELSVPLCLTHISRTSKAQSPGSARGS